ncbi:6,7-dimethyl-8-ribityllumazine synthase [Agriterribacter sp.]|uniref:6,7-dimethyl-8-ribityllumazine synthase n=1 Tax=Agriterribacter sp. TaxID=2821509 RepID=UPI002C1A46C4|nr:6,7-dimethyl-8-ribityllumazine synthase [Agriterribacter sp.]HRO46022.1 6,7-dimethyl-8-ribityllumazine synthase [Agriterribacter sp.]HRQ17058.1 6,7-dimethyl-8-ribityllumazine synthase [Agriterribacter sp.]
MAEITNSNLYHLDAGILPRDACVVIVRTEWNAAIVDRLEEGCRQVLTEHRVAFRVITVPGAFEVPFGISAYWNAHLQGQNRPDAFIALACVVRGGTPHFDYVCKGITDGIVQLNLTLPVPSVFGVLTVDTDEQAEERTGGRHGHKGKEAAITALKMIALKASLNKAI